MELFLTLAFTFLLVSVTVLISAVAVNAYQRRRARRMEELEGQSLDLNALEDDPDDPAIARERAAARSDAGVH